MFNADDTHLQCPNAPKRLKTGFNSKNINHQIKVGKLDLPVYDLNGRGPPEIESGRIPLGIENWFLSLSKDDKIKVLKKFESHIE